MAIGVKTVFYQAINMFVYALKYDISTLECMWTNLLLQPGSGCGGTAV